MNPIPNPNPFQSNNESIAMNSELLKPMKPIPDHLNAIKSVESSIKSNY